MSNDNFQFVWTQGTELYVVGPASAESDTKTLTKIDHIYDLNVPKPTRNIFTIQPLDRKSAIKLSGVEDPGEAGFSIYLDTTNPGHHYLKEMYDARADLTFIIGLDDKEAGAKEPELEGEELKLDSATRSYFVFKGELLSFPPDTPEDTAVSVVLDVLVKTLPEFTLKNLKAKARTAPVSKETK